MRDDVREAKIFRADRVQERLSSLQSHDVHRVEEPRGASGSSDQPNMLSFFNGRPHAEGLKAYNEWLAAHGPPPIPEGQK